MYEQPSCHAQVHNTFDVELLLMNVHSDYIYLDMQ